jgi:diguanylate cyclase
MTMSQVSPPHQPPPLDELHFQFQRIAPLRAGETGWHEALVRWHLPDGTIRGPLDVLPYWLAPNHQAEFTRFTIERAAATLVANDGARVSINLSPRQVAHPMAVATLEQLRPEIRSRMIVELTEQRMRDMQTLWNSVNELRERCELVVLDDVTRHDMSTRFRDDVPVDGVKLDRGVVGLLAEHEERQRTISFIRTCTDRFPIVVAEGLEEQSLQELLLELGVSHVQGFGIAMPRRQIGMPDRPEDERRGRGPQPTVPGPTGPLARETS